MREETTGDVHQSFCSVGVALEEPSPSWWESRGLNESIRGASVVEEAEGREGRNS